MTIYNNNGETITLTGKIFYRPEACFEAIYPDGSWGREHYEDVICDQGQVFTRIPGGDEKEECWDYAGSNDTYPDLESALDAFICNTASE
jgi:hypothetical protein